jgi:hypothetical protein
LTETYLPAQQTIKHTLQQHLVVSLVEFDFGTIFELENEFPRIERRAGWERVKSVEDQRLDLF